MHADEDRIGNKWDTSLCPDNDSCAKNCCLDGAQYASTYGASTSGDALSLGFVTKGSTGTNVGSRLYLMASGTTQTLSDFQVDHGLIMNRDEVPDVHSRWQRVHLRC